MRKNIFTGLALAVIGLTGLGLAARSDAAPAAPVAAAPDEHYAVSAACAKVCADCMVTCEATAHHCGESVAGGKKDHAKAMKLTADCAEFCGLSAKTTAGHSELAGVACTACAPACDLCVAECEKFADVPEMKACAEACKKCAASCGRTTRPQVPASSRTRPHGAGGVPSGSRAAPPRRLAAAVA